MNTAYLYTEYAIKYSLLVFQCKNNEGTVHILNDFVFSMSVGQSHRFYQVIIKQNEDVLTIEIDRRAKGLLHFVY